MTIGCYLIEACPVEQQALSSLDDDNQQSSSSAIVKDIFRTNTNCQMS